MSQTFVAHPPSPLSLNYRTYHILSTIVVLKILNLPMSNSCTRTVALNRSERCSQSIKNLLWNNFHQRKMQRLKEEPV